MSLTAIVLCRDAERDLPACLGSLAFADEILVVDSGSRDRSREIASDRGARVLERPLDGFDDQRNWAQARAAGDWVLFIDADERVPPALAAEIRDALSTDGPAPAAWSIPRRNHFLGRPMARCGWGRDRVTRLLRPGRARWQGRVHEVPVVQGAVGRLQKPLEHHPYPSLAAFWDKLERFSPMEAAADQEAGRRAGGLQMLVRPKLAFARAYLAQGACREGVHGLVLSTMAAFAAFTRALRLWERGIPPGVTAPPRGPRIAEIPSETGAPVSVLITTFNEEANIEGALASSAWADEVLVVDSFSTDRTMELASGASRVVQHEYVNPAAQKNWALPQLAHSWTMVLDADERFTPELAREVRHLLASPPPAAAFWIRRVNHFLGRRIRFCGWNRDRVIRLFDRRRSRYQDVEVHEEMEVDGAVGQLRSPLLHYTYTSVDQYWPKFRRYTDWGASQAYREGRRAGLYHLLGHPAGRFLKMYVARLGVLDGTHGLAISLMSFFSVFNKYAKLWERGLGEAVRERGAPAEGRRTSR
ncbi:MAG: glycosyltransferase family 2 protein [Acidobacteriota bacterium]